MTDELRAKATTAARAILSAAAIRLAEDPTSGLWNAIQEAMGDTIGALPSAQGAELRALAAVVAVTRLVAEAS